MGVLKLSWEIYLNAVPAYILSLSFPEKGRDMPFSFPAPGVITGSGNGSVGALGTSTCHEARNQCQHFYKNHPAVLALLLFLRNHQDLDGIWTVSLNQDLAFDAHPGRMAMKQRTAKVSVKNNNELSITFSWLSSPMGNKIFWTNTCVLMFAVCWCLMSTPESLFREDHLAQFYRHHILLAS